MTSISVASLESVEKPSVKQFCRQNRLHYTNHCPLHFSCEAILEIVIRQTSRVSIPQFVIACHPQISIFCIRRETRILDTQLLLLERLVLMGVVNGEYTQYIQTPLCVSDSVARNKMLNMECLELPNLEPCFRHWSHASLQTATDISKELLESKVHVLLRTMSDWLVQQCHWVQEYTKRKMILRYHPFPKICFQFLKFFVGVGMKRFDFAKLQNIDRVVKIGLQFHEHCLKCIVHVTFTAKKGQNSKTWVTV